MKIYLVGGAVRDQLLGLPIKEKDYVVVGSTPAEMLKLGYRQVGKDFPVFLHPETHEEYALARMERKVGRGYTGFDFDASPTVTLEEDLIRRDLTINAIAQTPDGILIDPYHGKSDLEQKLLRHVSQAFVEDPVRILRVARFAARFAELGFTVAPETVSLMKEMVKAGEVDALVAERVWKEFERALQERNPEEFFHVLASCNALPVLFPELTDEDMLTLQTVAPLVADPEIRFAALLHRHPETKIKNLCARLRVPASYQELSLLVTKHFQDYIKAKQLTAEESLKLFQDADAFRRDARFQKFLQTCAAINQNHVSEKYLQQVCLLAKAIDIKDILEKQQDGKIIAEHIKAKRLNAISKHIAQNN